MFPGSFPTLRCLLPALIRRNPSYPINCSRMTTSIDDHWKRIEPVNQVPPFSVYRKPIKKPHNDQRDYRAIQLDNGLQAFLVHDAETDKAAASLDVAVGHLGDPDDMPGLAHFCEHLLFMGTESFPSENEYTEFLSKNNGFSNAYTSTTNTNYYFNVATQSLEGALERFSAFFHCPLFASSCTTREINAVDSEHQKNHQSDIWRIYQLNKHLSKEGHVWSKFGSGSRYSLFKAARQLRHKGLLNGAATSSAPSPDSSRVPSPTPSSVSSAESEADADGGLVGRETRRRLVEWWSREYSANRMSLCIIGKESLDELAELTSRLFSPIPNRGCDALPMIYDHPFGPYEEGTMISVQTVMAFHALEISFPLEYQAPQWKYKPGNFISHLVGHEGPGSLLSYLKSKGWVTSLSSGPQNLARGIAMFKLTIHMTESGFKNHRSIILAAFKYLSLLRSSEFKPYLQKEISVMSMIQFRFSEKRRPDNYATSISERMSWPVPRESVISAPQLVEEWGNDPLPVQKVKEYLESFRIERGRVVLMAKAEEHAKLESDKSWLKEPWYETEYRVERFDDEFVRLTNGPNDITELFLPKPNEFIPANLDVGKKAVVEPAKRPHLIRETPLSQLWYKKDDRFWVPKAHVTIDIRSPLANDTARSSVITKLYCDIVKDVLAEFSYYAEIAGLTYRFIQHTTGMQVTTYGYNDKMAVLVEHILDRIKRLDIKPERLEIVREQAKRTWENFFMGQPYHLADYYGKYLLAENHWTIDENLKQLSSISAEDIESHVKDLLSQVHLRILVTGNIYKDEAIRIAELAESDLRPTKLSPHELNERGLILPQGSNYTWSSKLRNAEQVNSALTYYLHFGLVVNQHLRVTSALLVKILTEPAFSVLRTQEQLGYVVMCNTWTLPGSSEKGIRIVLQSGKQPGYLEQRVEAFLEKMKRTIEQMSDGAFREYKAGLEKGWLEADKNLTEEATRFMVHIGSGQLDFLRSENDASLLKDITKDNVLSLFLSRVHPSSSTRAKLSVHMHSQNPPKRISTEAAHAFALLAREAGHDISDNDFMVIMGTDGTVTPQEFVKHWAGLLGDLVNAKSLFLSLPALVKQYPIDGEGDDQAGPNAHYIEDPRSFKSNLSTTIDHGPFVEWGDLPIPRL